MTNTPSERVSKNADSEKITVNVGFVDLGQIDLIVSNGFYSNRTDFIRTAIRNHIEKHSDAVKDSARRQNLAVGLHDYSRDYLETLRAAGKTVNIRVIGLARIASDVSPELARSTISSITVLGALQTTSAVRSALSDRIS